MNDIIYKIISKTKDYPKVELVKVLKIKKNTIKVISIMDNYVFEYDKDYFLKNRQRATELDILNYKFELN